MKTLDKLVKSIVVAAGLGIGMLGFSAKAEAQCPGPFIPDNSTISLWHFDENNGSETYGENSSNPKAWKAVMFHNYPDRATDLWTSGMFGPGLKFDFPSYATLYDGVLIDYGNSLTVEAYINPEAVALPADQEFGSILTYSPMMFGLDRENRLYLRGVFRDFGNNTINLYFRGNSPVETGKFSYIAFSYGGGSTLDMYINGALDRHISFPSFTLDPDPHGESFGAAGWNSTQGAVGQFYGTIDELRISNVVREMTPCSITTPVTPTTWGKLKSIYR